MTIISRVIKPATELVGTAFLVGYLPFSVASLEDE